MILYPAIDILGGKAVRLVRGDFDAKTVYDEDPCSAARAWVAAGAEYLHVVDLDGAKEGRPANVEQLREIARETGVPVQYGGGLRSTQAVADALSVGAARVILGTVAFSDPTVLRDCLNTHGSERILVGVDVRGGSAMTHGWLQSTDVPARDAFATLREHGVSHFVFTNIDHDGMLDGPNLDEVVAAVQGVGEGSMIVSGGIGELAHLRALAALRKDQALDGLDGVIVGKALYEGRFTVAEARTALGE